MSLCKFLFFCLLLMFEWALSAMDVKSIETYGKKVTVFKNIPREHQTFAKAAQSLLLSCQNFDQINDLFSQIQARNLSLTSFIKSLFMEHYERRVLSFEGVRWKKIQERAQQIHNKIPPVLYILTHQFEELSAQEKRIITEIAKEHNNKFTFKYRSILELDTRFAMGIYKLYESIQGWALRASPLGKEAEASFRFYVLKAFQRLKNKDLLENRLLDGEDIENERNNKKSVLPEVTSKNHLKYLRASTYRSDVYALICQYEIDGSILPSIINAFVDDTFNFIVKNDFPISTKRNVIINNVGALLRLKQNDHQEEIKNAYENAKEWRTTIFAAPNPRLFNALKIINAAGQSLLLQDSNSIKKPFPGFDTYYSFLSSEMQDEEEY